VAAVDVVQSFLAAVPDLEARRLAHAEWGLTVPAERLGGQSLDVGLTVAGGLLRAKAPVLAPADGVDPWMLLWWNRQTRYVRFGCTQARELWVHADLPAAGLDETALDRLLGLVAEAALAVRRHAAAAAEAI
jgi:Putative bacterial sensory transduction regulator